MPDAPTFDYVIVGAGSAGCVLANRLTEDGAATVLRPRVRRLGPLGPHPDAGGPVDPDEHAEIQLGLPDRARAASRRPPPRTARAARCSADRPRSTASSTCAATRSISSAGRRKARRAGATATCCPTSGGPRAGRRAATPSAAVEGPLATRYGRVANPLYRAFVEAAGRPGYPVTTDINGDVSRRASAAWT